MVPFLAGSVANPSGMHTAARAAKTALEEAREEVAALCGASRREVVFTGGGSEADNLAVKGAALGGPRPRRGARRRRHDRDRAQGRARRRATGSSARASGSPGVGADAGGVVDLDALAAALDDRTAVVSVMLVNNEIGIVQPLAEVAALVRERAPRAVRAHRRGAGAAVARPRGRRRRRRPGRDLGPQVRRPEGRRRARRPRRRRARAARSRAAATSAGCAPGTPERRRHRRARGRAARHRTSAAAEEIARIAALRDRLDGRARARVPGLFVNGDPARRVAGHPAPARSRGVEAETLLVALDQHGVCAAAGSACASGAIEPSHVLLGDGHAARRARSSSVRFSASATRRRDADIDAALAVVPEAVRRSSRSGRR